MSDRFSADITIGGAVPRSLVAALCEAISDSGAGLDWEGGCDPGCAEDLLHLAEAEGARGTIRLHDCQASYGEFPELEAFLIANGIAFDRASEAKYDYDGEVLKFRPGHEPYHLLATQDGNTSISAGEIEDIVTRLDGIEGMRKDELLAAAEAVRDDLRSLLALDVPPVPAFTIVEG